MRAAGGSTAAGLQVLLAAVLFSTGGAAVKAAGAFSDWQVASFRAGIAVLALLAVGPLLGLPRPRLDLSSWLVGGAWAVTMILYVAANKRTTAASTIFLQSTAPLYLLVLGPRLLGESVRRRDLYFMAAMAGGLALFFVGVDPASQTAPEPLAGNLLAAGAGVTWALTILGLRYLGRGKPGREGVNLGVAVAGNLVACAVCLPLALPVAGAGAVDWGAVAYLGVFQVAGAYLFLAAGVRKLPALEVSLLLLLDPVLNPVWAWLLHDERPGVWSLAGGAVILAATAVKSRLDLGRGGERSRGAVPAAAGHSGDGGERSERGARGGEPE